VVRLPREPGRREARYAHLLSGPVTAGAAEAVAEPETVLAAQPQEERLTRVEEEVRELRAELAALKERLGL
jgi:uncharacterized protein YceH (UPF0502 family)